jgi:hypothetical protein
MGSDDYSRMFTLIPTQYTAIKAGQNKITAKIDGSKST